MGRSLFFAFLISASHLLICVWVSAFTGALPVAFFAAAGSGGGFWVLTAALLVADVPLPLFNFGF